MDMRTVGDKVHSHNSNYICSIAKSNGDSIEFSLLITEQRAVGFILAWSLAFLQPTLDHILPFFTKMSENKTWAKDP